MRHFGEIDFLMVKYKISNQVARKILTSCGTFDEAVDKLEQEKSKYTSFDSEFGDMSGGAQMVNHSLKAKSSIMLESKGKNLQTMANNYNLATSLEEGKKSHSEPKILPKSYTVHSSPAAKITKWIEVPIRELVDFCRYEVKHNKVNPKDFICPICRMDFYDDMLSLSDKEIDKLNTEMITKTLSIDVVMLSKCNKHFYHKSCVEQMVKYGSSVKCAICNTIYGILCGDMPKGTMNYTTINSPCKGYEGCGTIMIEYYFPSGKTNGEWYDGTQRTAYLPDNKEGREVLKLLKIAFDRKLLFTVGTSVTTGAQNSVVWNGVHHKTSLSGGATAHGYPDLTYLTRVKEELAAKGVFSE